MAASSVMLALPDILRSVGVKVVEFDGWRDRGRPYDFTPRGVILHHDGSPIGPAQPPENYARFLFVTGRPDEGIPAPLCQVWIDYYGAWWIGAAGRANHAGEGSGWGVFPRDQGNQYGIGVEMDNTSNEPTTPAQYESLHRGLPALFAANGWNPANALGSHKEYAPGRKFDPDDIDMAALRSYVSGALTDGEDDMFSEDDRKLLRTIALNKDGKWAVAQGQKTVGDALPVMVGQAQTTHNDVQDLKAEVAAQGQKLDQILTLLKG